MNLTTCYQYKVRVPKCVASRQTDKVITEGDEKNVYHIYFNYLLI